MEIQRDPKKLLTSCENLFTQELFMGESTVFSIASSQLRIEKPYLGVQKSDRDRARPSVSDLIERY